MGDKGSESEAGLLRGFILGAAGFLFVSFLASWAGITHTEIWKSISTDATQSGWSTTFRNILLPIIATVAVILGWWRTRTSQQQADTAIRQANTAEDGLNIDRFQKGAQLLNDAEKGTWLAGLQTLRDLAHADPEKYYRPVVEQMCEFIAVCSRSDTRTWEEDLNRYGEERKRRREINQTNSPEDSEDTTLSFPEPPDCKPEVVRTMIFLSELLCDDYLRKEVQLPGPTWPKVMNANLRRAHLEKLDLRNAYFYGADFTGASLISMRFDGTLFNDSNFSRTNMFQPNFQGAQLQGANFSSAHIRVFTPPAMVVLTNCWYWNDSEPIVADMSDKPIPFRGTSPFPYTLREAYIRTQRRGRPDVARLPKYGHIGSPSAK